LRVKTIPELKAQIDQAEVQLAKLRVDVGAGRVKNSQQLNQQRHDLARLKTIWQQKEMNESA